MGAEGGERFQSLTLLAVSRHRDADHFAELWGGVVRVAIRERTIMQLTYRSLDGRESQRHIHPLGLTLFDDVWLLTAWCESAKDFRNFRLDRIASIEDTGKKSHPRQGQLFKDYLATL